MFEEKDLKEELEAKLRSCMYKGGSVKLQNITKVDDRFYIVEVVEYRNSKEETIFKTIDVMKNRTLSNVSYSLDYQLLITLGYKYGEDENNRFAKYAYRMMAYTE
jgi:hypothetical protein